MTPRPWRNRGALSLLLIAGAAAAYAMAAQAPDSRFCDAMRWRLIGPTRSGRVSAATGVPGDPTVYYIGAPDGGLWKTTDGGTVWRPIFDAVHAPSIGAIAVAAANHSIVYVGTGHNLIGKGVFRSDDAGTTWRAAGLADTKYITALLVDPKNPDVALAGVGSGGNFGTMVFYNNNPSAARGVYRTTDGGRTWTHVLAVDPSLGVVDLASDVNDLRVVYASMAGPGGSGGRAASPSTPPSGPGIFQSTDGGATWTRLVAKGLPAVAGVYLAVAPGTESRRLYALISGRGGALYRSEDGGASWDLGTSHIASAFGPIGVDPANPDVVYTMGTSVYRSTDGGKTLEPFKGAPGGDDPRSFWIDPTNARRMIVGADQGPTISVDGGATWTPWYAVPNGEHYFVSTDDQAPYWIYAAQQDSGTVAIKSRSDFGAIRSSDWYPVGGYEQGHIFADPFDWRFVYSHGGGHTVLRFDRETGHVGPIYVPPAQDRFGPRPAMTLSPKDPRLLFLGAQYVLETTDRGATWTTISPDLTNNKGTLTALAPSPLDTQVLWAGSSNGVVSLTRDGGRTWKNVSPPDLATAPAIALWSMEASSHDAGAAYVAVIDLSDQRVPRLYRTLDFGESWTRIVNGLDPDVPTRVVREDPVRSNLLYAGTQTGAWVSFDRGDRWQPLQLNLPTVAVNDITIHQNDLVIATWGRGLWVLDDVTPLRQIDTARASADPAFLFEPAPALRLHWDVNQDTPLPPEVLTGQNPPDGAIVDYWLRADVTSPITLQVTDANGELIREYSNAPAAPDSSMANVPAYWFKPPEADQLPATQGMHRFVWDLRYQTPPSINYDASGNPAYFTSYGIIAPAILGQSPRQQPLGPLVAPGTYRVSLTVAGRTSSHSLVVAADPRGRASAEDLRALISWQRRLAAGISSVHDVIEALRALRREVAERASSDAVDADVAAAAQACDRAALGAIVNLAARRSLVEDLAMLENADMRPNDSAVAAFQASCAAASDAITRARGVVSRELATVNATLSKAGQRQIAAPEWRGTGCGTPGAPFLH